MLVLVGKTCSGKNTVRDILVNDFAMDPVITHTTRPPREGEENYVDYIFINDKHFHILEKEGWFAEITKYNVASGDTWYYASATSDYEDSDNKVIILNPDGLKQIRKLGYPVFAVELTAPDIAERLRKRGDNPKEAQRRILADEEDFKGINEFINGKFINYGNPYYTAKKVYDAYQYWIERRSNVGN